MLELSHGSADFPQQGTAYDACHWSSLGQCAFELCAKWWVHGLRLLSRTKLHWTVPFQVTNGQDFHGGRQRAKDLPRWTPRVLLRLSQWSTGRLIGQLKSSNHPLQSRPVVEPALSCFPVARYISRLISVVP